MSRSQRILVTGATGFIGRILQPALEAQGHTVIPTSRRDLSGYVNVGVAGPATDWAGVLVDIDSVVHLAGRVHILTEDSSDPAAAFESVNSIGTERLAEQAAEYGVRRLVLLSTVGIVGSAVAQVVDESTPPNPTNHYAASKLEAELRLLDIGRRTGLEAVVLRAPLVYGPGAPGSLTRLRPLVEKGIPIPFGSINNQRSAIAVGNLVSAIGVAIDSDRVANRTLYVEDGTLWSSLEMAERVGQTIGRSPRLVRVPVSVLRWTLNSIGKRGLVDRLLGSLVVDGSKFRSLTGWVPPLPVEEALDHGVV